MRRTPMPVAAGILSIVSGSLGLIAFTAFLIGALIVGWTAVGVGVWAPGIDLVLGASLLFKVVSLLVSVLALVGGIYAVQRRQWGWALAGSICALAPTFVFGLIAIILTALSRDEFAQ